MSKWYRLDPITHEVIEIGDTTAYVEYVNSLGGEHSLWDDPNRIVALDNIGESRVSTVFLLLDHSWNTGRNPDYKPLVFETMVFGGYHDGYMERYNTWDQAYVGHRRVIEMIRQDNRNLKLRLSGIYRTIKLWYKKKTKPIRLRYLRWKLNREDKKRRTQTPEENQL